MRPGLPKLREKLLRQRRRQVANAFRTAGSTFHTEHSFDHQDVVRSPERDVLVVLDQKILHVEEIGVFFRMRQDLDDCLHLFLT